MLANFNNFFLHRNQKPFADKTRVIFSTAP